MMQRTQCNCPLSALQRIAASLSQGILPFDDVLHIGTELKGYLPKIVKCERCGASKRTANLLSQIIPRLISFYEAAHLNVAAGDRGLLLRTTSANTQYHHQNQNHMQPVERGGPSGPAPPSPQPECQSLPCEMKLGRLPIDRSEARILVEVVLVDACLDLNQQMQEWKAAADASMHLIDAGREPVDAIIAHCSDRLARLIGLLQLGGLSPVQS